MNIAKFKVNITNLIDALGYKVFIGSLELYNTIREVDNRVLLIDGLKNIPLASKDCKTNTELTFWLMNKQPLDIKQTDLEGYNILTEDSMRVDAVAIYNALLGSTFIQPLNAIYNVDSSYYPSTNSYVVNNQSLLTFKLNVNIYEV